MFPQENEEIFLEDEKLQDAPLKYPGFNKSMKKTSGKDKTFEVNLTYEQYQVIKMKLPKGYSLKEKKKKKKMSFSIIQPQKKVHFEPKVSMKAINLTKTSANYRKPEIPLQISPQTSNNLHKNTSETSIFNETLSDHEFKRISTALKNFKIPNEILKRCYKILLILKIHQKVKPFLEPVDPVALKIPDYFTIIKEPMDLGTVERKLLEGKYKDQNEFEQDVHKVWSNSLTYNPPFTKIHQITLEMKQYFEQLLIESKCEEERKKDPGSNIDKKIDKMLVSFESLFKKDPGNFVSVFRNKVRKLASMPMSALDRKKLTQNLIQISNVEMTGVLELINEGGLDKSKEKRQMELNLNSLSNEKLRMIESYVDFLEKHRRQRLSDKEKKRERDETKRKAPPKAAEAASRKAAFSSTNSSFITNSDFSEDDFENK